MSGRIGCLLLFLCSCVQAEQALYDCLNKFEYTNLPEQVCKRVKKHRQVSKGDFVGLGFMDQLMLISEQAEPLDYLNEVLRDEVLGIHKSELNSGLFGIAAKKLLSILGGVPVASSSKTYAIELKPLAIIGVLAFDVYQGVDVMSQPGQAEDDLETPDSLLTDLELTPDLSSFAMGEGLFGTTAAEHAHLHFGYKRLVELLPWQPLAIRMLELFSFMYPERVLAKSVSCEFGTYGEVVLFCPYLRDGDKKRKEGKRHKKSHKKETKANAVWFDGQSVL